MKARMKPGGLLIASIRDYDEILREHPVVTQPALTRGAADVRIAFQHWKWHRDGRTYDQHLFIVGGDGDRWTLRHYGGISHALLRAELAGHLSDAGLSGIKWLMPDRTGYHQPIVIARAR